MTKITERGWSTHFIGAHNCLFRRNTLIEGDNDNVIVSTVGGLRRNYGLIEPIREVDKYYETLVFGTKEDGPYIDTNLKDQRSHALDAQICAKNLKDLPDNVDNKANEMHEAIVAAFVEQFNQ